MSKKSLATVSIFLIHASQDIHFKNLFIVQHTAHFHKFYLRSSPAKFKIIRLEFYFVYTALKSLSNAVESVLGGNITHRLLTHTFPLKSSDVLDLQNMFEKNPDARDALVM